MGGELQALRLCSAGKGGRLGRFGIRDAASSGKNQDGVGGGLDKNDCFYSALVVKDGRDRRVGWGASMWDVLLYRVYCFDVGFIYCAALGFVGNQVFFVVVSLPDTWVGDRWYDMRVFFLLTYF